MAEGTSCPECGSSNVVDDDLYSQPQLVCADCGSVVSEGLLTTTRSEEVQGTDVKYYESTARDKQPCRNQIKGLKRVRTLCRILRFPKVVEETAESLFGRAYEHPDFLRVSLQKKEVLAGCCVLLSCRQHNWPIAMGTVSSLLEADQCLMGTVYRELIKSLNLEAPTTSISELLESHCNGYQLSPPRVAQVFCESPDKLAGRASVLVELASDTWLVTGRHPVPVLVASVYLAWLSLKPCPERLRLSLNKFCQLAKVPVPGPAAKRTAELKDILCKLGRELPWLRGAPVDPWSVATLTEDILKHRLTLLKRAMRSHEDSLQAETCTQGPPSAEPAQESDRPNGETEESDRPDGEPREPNGNIAQEEVAPFSGVVETAPVLHWGKRNLFVPPCARNPPKKPKRDDGPVVTGNEEISDSEIEEYLRTPQEMREFAASQKKLL